MKRSGLSARGLALVIDPEREEASHWRRFFVTRDGRTRERLFNRYVGFARSLARRHARRVALRADMHEDLEQFAFRGLLEAIDRFDPARGVMFSGFAKLRISGSIIDGLGKLDENAAMARFRAQRDRERMASLVPDQADLPATQQLADLVAELALGLMLEQHDSADQSDIAGNPDNGFDSLAWRETRSTLGERVNQLPETERTVIRQHYQNGLLFTQIASMLGLSKGRVSQLHSSALARLRKSMRTFR